MMNKTLALRPASFLAGLTLTVLLAGCAASRAFDDGNALLASGKHGPGLARLEEAVKLDPRNVEYQIALASRRMSVLNRLMMTAEASRREGRLTDAEKQYQEVLLIDSHHAMARQGMDALLVERRHRARLQEVETLLRTNELADLKLAQEKLRSVLSESPDHRLAMNLQTRALEALSKYQRPDVRLAEVFRKPVSLQFRDAPLKAVLDLISQVSGLNFILDKDIRPDLKANIFVKDNSIEDVLRLLMVTNQLEQKILNANTVLIYPNNPQKLKDYQSLTMRTFYLTNADVKAVSNSIKTIVKTKDLVIDERLGIIMMRDTPEAVRLAERIVALQDLNDPEVMLDVEILEIKRSRLMELGIEWPSQMSMSPLQISGIPITLQDLRNLGSSNIQVSNIATTIQARKENQDSNILANPRIRVRNKEKAKILIGDRVPVITTTSGSTGFVSDSISYVDVGLKLDVEPNIYLDDEVAIKVNLEVSNLVKEVKSPSGTQAYQIGTRGANTVLRLKDGETQVLAGLINDEDRSTAKKVPGVGELPLLNRLFGSQKDDVQRSEILLSITPRVVRSIRRPDLLAAEFDSGTEAVIGAAPLTLGLVEPTKVPSLGGGAAQSKERVQEGVMEKKEGANSPSAVSVGGLGLSWQGPAQVKATEQFSVVLHVSSQQALRSMPVMLGFDPQELQLVGVQEGSFFNQAGGRSTFSHRTDAAQGKLFVAALREARNAGDAAVNGSGSLLTVTFKALKPSVDPSGTRIRLLSASPEPAPAAPVQVPMEQTIKIVP